MRVGFMELLGAVIRITKHKSIRRITAWNSSSCTSTSISRTKSVARPDSPAVIPLLPGRIRSINQSLSGWCHHKEPQQLACAPPTHHRLNDVRWSLMPNQSVPRWLGAKHNSLILPATAAGGSPPSDSSVQRAAWQANSGGNWWCFCV